MTAPSNFKVALACGVAGAYVDVTTYLRGNESVTINAGRESQFDNTSPSVFSFTLDNSTGDYTPDNPTSTLATKLVEGMGVCVQIGSRLTSGTIRSIVPFFRSTVGSSAQVRITCDDMLGGGSRVELTDSLTDSMVIGSGAYCYWPFSDAANSTVAAEMSGNNGPTFKNRTSGTTTFGVAGFTQTFGDTQLQLSNDAAGFPAEFGTDGGTGLSPFSTISYPANSMGTWGLWMTPLEANSHTLVRIRCNGFASSDFLFGITALTNQYYLSMGNTSMTSTMPVQIGVPRYVSLTVTANGSTSITGTLRVDGVSLGSLVFVPWGADPAGLSTNALRTPKFVRFYFDYYPPDMAPINVAHLSHSPSLIPEYQSPLSTTEAVLLTAVKQRVPELTLATLPADLSTAPVAVGASDSSALDRLNDVIRTEQGYIYTSTTGTLLAPVQQINVRARTRPPAVSYSFDVATEIVDAPEFARTISDAVSSVTVSGTGSVTVTDSTLVTRFGSANTSARILNTDQNDLRGWGEDRLDRGVVEGVPITSITINARNTPTDRWADLTGMVPGDRIRVTGLPTAQLGYSTWDGWLLGKKESHTGERGMFTLYLQPVLPDTGIYDTDRFMADGSLTLSSAIASTSATSMSVATTGPKLETTTFPYDLYVDSEQVRVTACTSATPQVATITRAVNGTTAATHTTSAVIEVVDDALYAF